MQNSKYFYHYEVFREIGKDMHGQSAGPSYALRREKEGWGGEEGWEGVNGRGGGGGSKTFGFKLVSPNNRTIFGMFELHDLRCRMHHGVIERKEMKRNKKKTFSLFFFSSVAALLQAEVFTESKVRGQRRFNTLV